jgi:hypothetical protein
MESSSPSSDTILIDGESYALDQLPAPASRIVAAARQDLVSETDLPMFVADVASIVRLVQDSQSAAEASGFVELAVDLGAVSAQCARILSSSVAAMERIHIVSLGIVKDMPENMRGLYSVSRLDAIQSALLENDERAARLGETADAILMELVRATEQASEALSRAESHRSLCDTKRRALQVDLDKLSVWKDSAWEAHSLVLDSLSDAGKEYAVRLRRERAAARRARFFGMFGWVESVDSALQWQFAITALEPVTNALRSVQSEADAATAARESILVSKIEQRKMHNDCVTAISESSVRMKEASVELNSVENAVVALQRIGRDLSRLSVNAHQMTTFWEQVRSSVNRLSACPVRRLVELTRPDKRLVRDDAVRAPGILRLWTVGTGLKRRCVYYYAQWNALALVSSECMDVMKRAVAADSEP